MPTSRRTWRGENENQLRNQQGYSSLLGNGLFGGLLNDDYSNQFFGQITGREAPQSVFTTTQQGPYPWSTPSQQLDVSSLLSPAMAALQAAEPWVPMAA